VALSRSVKTKLLTIAIATVLFAAVASMLAALMNYPLDQTVVGALLLGLSVGAIEEFYFAGRSGRWLRAMHPLASLALYGVILIAVGLIVIHVNHAVWGRLDQLPAAYARLHVTLPITFGLAIAAITVIRVTGFLGARNVVYLMVGKYHRPVMEKKVFLFLDLKGSTGLVERLGPIEARALIGKFFFDISAPIADNGGEVYRFTGDGVVATWSWNEALDGDAILKAIDGIRDAVARDEAEYVRRFGVAPRFRIGVHGGNIVVSEEGDIRRAIGFYGDTIHIAARMEQKAKELGVDIVISEALASRLECRNQRLTLIAEETVRGISQPIGMYTMTGEEAGNA